MRGMKTSLGQEQLDQVLEMNDNDETEVYANTSSSNPMHGSKKLMHNTLDLKRSQGEPIMIERDEENPALDAEIEADILNSSQRQGLAESEHVKLDERGGSHLS